MTIKEIRRIVNLQQEEFSSVFLERIVPELKKHSIYLRRRLDLNNKQREFVEHYFHDHRLNKGKHVVVRICGTLFSRPHASLCSTGAVSG
jgi:hypothetical protein